MDNLYAIILAAGKGTRISTGSRRVEFPKVLRRIAGKSLISYVIDSIHGAGVNDINIIVGFGADRVKMTVGSGYHYILQEKQLGSGHAVACAKSALEKRGGHAIIACGDSPMFTPATILALIERHLSTGAIITLVSAMLDDPTGYGRIKRGLSGEIVGIVEEKCASVKEQAIREINGGAYAFDSRWLWENISSIGRKKAGEMGLTELVEVAVTQGKRVEAVQAAAEEVMGVNTPADLRRVRDILRRRAVLHNL